MKTINKIVRIGTLEMQRRYGKRDVSIYCKVTFKDEKFSISGVIGPTHGGNAIGGCGQINMEFEHRNQKDNDKRYSAPIKPEEIKFTKGWDKEKWFDFLDIWKKYHLNDMQANCVHQVGPEWEPQDVILYHFELNEKTRNAREVAKNSALKVLETGKPFKPTKGQLSLQALKSSLTYHKEKLPKYMAKFYQPCIKRYNWQKGFTETKSTAWLHESEHPKGYLSKACPVCGYKYGSAWNRIDVPGEVLAFIESLPDADKSPAWV